MFRFVTFILQYVTYMAQFMLSLFNEPKVKKRSAVDSSKVCMFACLYIYF